MKSEVYIAATAWILVCVGIYMYQGSRDLHPDRSKEVARDQEAMRKHAAEYRELPDNSSGEAQHTY